MSYAFMQINLVFVEKYVSNIHPILLKLYSSILQYSYFLLSDIPSWNSVTVSQV